MYQLGIKNSQPVHFLNFGRKCTHWELITLSQYIFSILEEDVPHVPSRYTPPPPKLIKCTVSELVIPSQYIFPQHRDNVPAENYEFPAGTFSAKVEKMHPCPPYY